MDALALCCSGLRERSGERVAFLQIKKGLSADNPFFGFEPKALTSAQLLPHVPHGGYRLAPELPHSGRVRDS